MNFIEYVWFCGYYDNVLVEKLLGIFFVRGDFLFFIVKLLEEFIEEERKGVFGWWKCCRCWVLSSLFKLFEECGECDYVFVDCLNCMIVNFFGLWEIVISDKRVVGEFD